MYTDELGRPVSRCPWTNLPGMDRPHVFGVGAKQRCEEDPKKQPLLVLHARIHICAGESWKNPLSLQTTPSNRVNDMAPKSP